MFAAGSDETLDRSAPEGTEAGRTGRRSIVADNTVDVSADGVCRPSLSPINDHSLKLFWREVEIDGKGEV